MKSTTKEVIYMASNAYVLSNIQNLHNGSVEAVGGKILKIRTLDGEFLFVDYFAGNTLWYTTAGKWEVTDPNTCRLTTTNTVYEFVRLNNLPAEMADPQAEKNDPSKFEVIGEKEDFKGINYGDGYNKHTFQFSREITEEEFVAFLTERKFDLTPKGDWWKNYAKIEGSGDTWVYTWVLVYTD